MSQGINIFDLNDPFYTDLCYDFDNPMKKDIPLSSRIQILYPDVELCDDGCEIKGINLEDMTSTCDCLFNDLSNSNIIKDNPLAESALGDVFDLINNSNILVFKCFKNIFTHFSRSIGGWISLTLILGQIGLSLTFFLFQSTQVSKYLFNLTKNYIKLVTTKSLNSPPKKVKLSDNKSDNIKSHKKTEKKFHNIKYKNKRNKNFQKFTTNSEKNSADKVIIPVQSEFLAAKGMSHLMTSILQVRKYINPNLKVGGILLTMVDGRTNLSKDISRELKETYGTVFKLFDSTIPRAVKVAETTRLGESILSYDKNSKIAESYKNFAKEVINYEREEKTRNTNAVQVR